MIRRKKREDSELKSEGDDKGKGGEEYIKEEGGRTERRAQGRGNK